MTISEQKVSEIIGGGYDEFWNCTTRYRVLKGGKASKKSSTAALNFIFRLMKYPKANLLVVRRVMNTHRDSTFAQLSWAQSRLGVSHLWSNTVSPMEMCFLPTGQKILFRGFDDVLKLASATVSSGVLNFVWIEEAFEIEREADFDKLDLSVPRGKTPQGIFKQTTLTFNPWSATHWLKKRFFDVPSPEVSTFTANYKCNEFLDSTDLAVFSRMEKTNRRKYEVAALGNWGISEGLVFENWQVAALDIPSTESYMWKDFFGLDYGYTNDPTAFIAFKVNPVKREIYIYDEIYRKRMLNRDIAAEIIRRGFAKERIRADSAEPKSNDDLKRMGISRICPSQKGRDSILHGIAEISEYKIYVNPICTNTIYELSNYVYEDKPSATGQIMPADRNNHLCDAMRYAFCDVKFFKPLSDTEPIRAPYKPDIFGSDFK
ncbi:MAG: PBSX family phage terminase large subunit [Clostridia bacterium]|nr:PBSX family phage terminase large subunit [Clostridia bacterium]